MADLTEIAALINLSRDELLTQLGSSDDAAFATPEDQLQRGRNFFRNTIEKYRSAICANDQIKKYIRSDGGALKVQAAAAIADLIGGHGAVTVAVLVVQSGIRDLCSDGWRNVI
jgi:hypothetical protein